jgi:hypothetical protein
MEEPIKTNPNVHTQDNFIQATSSQIWISCRTSAPWQRTLAVPIGHSAGCFKSLPLVVRLLAFCLPGPQLAPKPHRMPGFRTMAIV